MKELILYLIIIVFFSAYEASQTIFKTCSSSESCVPQNKCEAVTKITSKGRMTQQERIYLQSKLCNFVNRQNYFCCAANTTKPKPSHLPEAPQCGVYFGDRIVNGEDAYIDEFPWFALIQFTKKNNEIAHKCGGSLINSQHVLTAAHCHTRISKNWRISKVRLGEWDLRTNPDCDEDLCNLPYVDVPVRQIIIHPEYYSIGSAQYNDIAILKLGRKVEFNNWIKPICLPIDSRVKNIDFTAHLLEVVGFGITENGTSSYVKKKVELEGWTQANCHAQYGRLGVKLFKNQFCAGNDKKDSCQGDSGGPLMKFGNFPNNKFGHYVQFGLVSFGMKNCGADDTPGVYVRITDYMDWIIENTKES